MPGLLIIIASTRPGRIGLPVANWLVQQATPHGSFELDGGASSLGRMAAICKPR